MTSTEIAVGIIEILGVLMALMIFTIENERLPGRYCSWTPYISGKGDHYRGTSEITVGVRKKSTYVPLRTLDAKADDFDDLLAESQSAARERCVLLNSTARAIGRRLPS